MTGKMWNLWHGCHKKSEGCQHCYVFRRDAEFEKDSNVLTKTVPFHFKQTGALFRKDGRLYNIPWNQQMTQAHKVAIDYHTM